MYDTENKKYYQPLTREMYQQYSEEYKTRLFEHNRALLFKYIKSLKQEDKRLDNGEVYWYIYTYAKQAYDCYLWYYDLPDTEETNNT